MKLTSRPPPLRLTALAFSLLLGAAACSTPPAERTSAKTKATQALRSAGAPDVLLVNALLRQFADQNTQQALTFVKQAAASAPERIDIAWLHAQMCVQSRGCEPEPLNARLLKLDPTNGTAWLGALAQAQQDKDRAAEDQILEALSRSKQFNIYWNTLASRVAVAFSEEVAATKGDKLSDPLTRAMNQTVNWLSAFAVPAFQPLAESCGATRMVNAATAQRCALIAAALQRSDTYLAEGMGLGIAQRIATQGTQAATQVNERIAVARYQRDTAGEIIESQPERDQLARELLKLMASLPREQDVFIAVIRWANRPLAPTAGKTGQ